DYTVAFKDWNGTILSSNTYHWGEAVVAPADPQRAADNTYTYAFAGWDKQVIACAGNATYTATYIPTYIDYTVTFQNWDGAQLSQKTYHWGDKVTPPGTGGTDSE
ncbi:MAG: InlB B-repeat-containing protein, partial [Bacteroidales bacterium]|nr:InlB B-repeat-containing protein [Bacteroidales bacterium]